MENFPSSTNRPPRAIARPSIPQKGSATWTVTLSNTIRKLPVGVIIPFFSYLVVTGNSPQCKPRVGRSVSSTVGQGWSAGVVTFSCPSTNPVSQIASSKQKSSSKISKAPSAQPVHAFQSSLSDINPKYFSPPGGK